jgi:hypothetical protein
MRRSLIGLVAVAIVAGCATTENYEAMLKTRVGRSEVELVQAWGPPSSIYQSTNAKYFTYAKSKTCGAGNDAITCLCNTSFELANDRITSWRWDGNGCTAYPPELVSSPFPTGQSQANTTQAGATPPSTDSCTFDSQCMSGNCEFGKCSPFKKIGACTFDSDCSYGEECRASSCYRKINACYFDSDCISGRCIFGSCM